MGTVVSRPPRILKFGLEPGRVLTSAYIVEEFLGAGYEGEVYRVRETRTRAYRAAKLFFPHRNKRDRTARRYARKLDRLRTCPIVIQYHHAETLQICQQPVTCLIGEYVDGVLLSQYITSHKGKRISPFKALHLFYPMVCGLEMIHRKKEYHGDIHSDNILVMPVGIFFDIKLVDFYDLGQSTRDRRQDDIVDLVHLLHESIGGQRWYRTMPDEIKAICRGLRRDLILESFPTVRHLREHLEGNRK